MLFVNNKEDDVIVQVSLQESVPEKSERGQGKAKQ